MLSAEHVEQVYVMVGPVVKVDRRIRWHYTTTILRLRIGARLTRYRNCKFHNGCLTISRHADGISQYSVPPSAGPLLPLGGASILPSACPTGHRSAAARQPAGLLLSTGVCSKYQSTAAGVALLAPALSSKCERHHGGGGSTQTCL